MSQPGGGPSPAERYYVRRLLGAGGFGDAYLADDLVLRREVVIKVLRDGHGDIRDRFLREARILARVRHPNVVEVYDYGVDPDGRPFFVMELAAGEPLEKRLARGPLSVAEACSITAQACDALAAAHALGVVHRDVKPANLLVDPHGHVKVIDFGIAKKVIAESSPPTAPLTAVGTMLGTPRYIAPEQVLGRTIGPAADLYAIGCVLFVAVTGRPPFEGERQELLLHHVHTPAPSISSAIGRSAPADLEALVARLLTKDPSARGDRAAEVAAALRAMVSAHAALGVIAVAPSLRSDDARTSGQGALASTMASNPPLASASTMDPRAATSASTAPANPRPAPPPTLTSTIAMPQPSSAPTAPASPENTRKTGLFVVALVAMGLLLAMSITLVAILLARSSAGSSSSASEPDEAIFEVDRVRSAIQDAGWEILGEVPYVAENGTTHAFQLSKDKGKSRAQITIYIVRDLPLSQHWAEEQHKGNPLAEIVQKGRSLAVVRVDPDDLTLARALAHKVFKER